jgi:hypothetical protein
MVLHAAQPGIALPALPRLTTTVPKEYVHRACLAEVFLTGCTSEGDQRFSLTGQWPRAHTLFSNGIRHDPHRWRRPSVRQGCSSRTPSWTCRSDSGS